MKDHLNSNNSDLLYKETLIHRSNNNNNNQSYSKIVDLRNEYLTSNLHNPFLNTNFFSFHFRPVDESTSKAINQNQDKYHKNINSFLYSGNIQDYVSRNQNETKKEEKIIEQIHPILRNSFMRPQVLVNTNKKQFSSIKVADSSKESFTSAFIKRTYSEKSNSSFSNYSLSSASITKPEASQTITNEKKKINHRVQSSPRKPPTFVPNKNQIEILLDSKKAREAFFQRLKSTENNSNNNSSAKVAYSRLELENDMRFRPSSKTSFKSMDTDKKFDEKQTNLKSATLRRTESLIKSESLNTNEPDQNLSNKVYDAKNNFANLVKIDTQFKSQRTAENETANSNNYGNKLETKQDINEPKKADCEHINIEQNLNPCTDLNINNEKELLNNAALKTLIKRRNSLANEQNYRPASMYRQETIQIEEIPISTMVQKLLQNNLQVDYTLRRTQVESSNSNNLEEENQFSYTIRSNLPSTLNVQEDQGKNFSRSSQMSTQSSSSTESKHVISNEQLLNFNPQKLISTPPIQQDTNQISNSTSQLQSIPTQDSNLSLIK
jgi:hypothetical protein